MDRRTLRFAIDANVTELFAAMIAAWNKVPAAVH